MHFYQMQSIAITQDLRKFFYKNPENSIDFGNVLVKPNGNIMQFLKKKKTVHLKPLFPCKLSWDFSIKEESNTIIHKWQITFQISDLKGNHFLNLLNDNYLLIKLFYMKSGPWLNVKDESSGLCLFEFSFSFSFSFQFIFFYF